MSQGILGGIVGSHPRLNDILGGKVSSVAPGGILTKGHIQHGHFTAKNAGWYTVSFSTAFTSLPDVVAVQGPRGQSITPLKLTPPTLPSLAIPTPTLAILKITRPSSPASWGTNWKNTISYWCSSTIGNIPTIGGYICGTVDSTFGQLAYYLGNAAQFLYYLLDWPALAGYIESAVEAKAAADINAMISDLQSIVSGIVSDANNALSTVESHAQDAINGFYNALNSAIGLAPGIAIPATLVRNVTTTGCEIYSPGNNVQVFWIATSSGA